MKVKIVGKKIGEFTDRKTGEYISFGKMSFISPFPLDAKGCEGMQATEISVKPDVLRNIPVPTGAELDFSQKGQLVGITLCELSEVE